MSSTKRSIISPLVKIKELESDPKLVELINRFLPSNYDFEVPKTVWRIQKNPQCRTVALQMPEGLLIFGTALADVLKLFTGVDTILMGDITYGACCVDDYSAEMLGADLLVHYGHSCLVPTSVANKIDTIYVFVTIKIDTSHAVSSIKSLLENENISTLKKRSGKICQENDDEICDKMGKKSLCLVSTIQFASSLGEIKSQIESDSIGERWSVAIPRSKPLSNGEILGCTAPRVQDSLIVYVGDGRFHLEAIMMANPLLDAYRYDPYIKTMTHETFDHSALSTVRQSAVSILKSAPPPHLTIGVILGTLGRQGNVKPVTHVIEQLKNKNYNVPLVLMSEISPAKLNLFKNINCWVQFACPRLSIDWGSAFSVPILTPYEAIWGSEGEKNKKYEGHPMDYYAYESTGPHTPNFNPTTNKKCSSKCS